MSCPLFSKWGKFGSDVVTFKVSEEFSFFMAEMKR